MRKITITKNYSFRPYIFKIISFFLAVLFIPFIIVGAYKGALLSVNDEGDIISEHKETVDVYFHTENKVKTINLFDYLCSVLAAEIPVSYKEETLKAQTVAIFTYLVYRIQGEKLSPTLSQKHLGACICADPSHCKGFLTKEQMLSLWGEKNFEINYNKIKAAVNEVYLKVMLYDSSPINSVFHSVSSGITESALSVWGFDVPYLQETVSSADKGADNYQAVKSVDISTFKEKLTSAYPACDFSKEQNTWITDITRSNAGGVKSLCIASVVISGQDFAALFSLNSSNFEISLTQTSATFTTKGCGHGVGMSQYGANVLAKEGIKYQEILKTYYKGITFADYDW